MHCYLGFLLVLISMLLLKNAADEHLPMQGFVGESVKLQCNKPSSRVRRLYFQMESDGEEIFINGFDKDIILTPTIYTNRTKVNNSELSMEFFNLTLADTGIYKCIAFFENTLSNNETKFSLTIAAKYSVPNITSQQCNPKHKEGKCVISCSSSGGFPISNVTWVPSIANLQVEEESHMLDRLTGFYNVSQRISLNCSQTENISCSIGGAHSKNITVCTPVPVIDPDKVLTIASGLLLLVIGLIIAFVLITRRRRLTPQEETGEEMENLNSPDG